MKNIISNITTIHYICQVPIWVILLDEAENLNLLRQLQFSLLVLLKSYNGLDISISSPSF